MSCVLGECGFKHFVSLFITVYLDRKEACLLPCLYANVGLDSFYAVYMLMWVLILSMFANVGLDSFYVWLWIQRFQAATGVSKMRVFLVFLCFWAAVTEAEYLKYKDPKQPLNVRIKDLLGRMTLEEKIGQMTQIERKVATPDVMKQYFIGNSTVCFSCSIFSSRSLVFS